MPSPCAACPFSKAVKPGALGGSEPETYIGQAHGPFLLPCHKACDFDDPDWKVKTIDTPQCAGAAIFRANIGVADKMPPAIHALPPSDAVFTSEAAFLAHHKGISLMEATALLHVTPAYVLLARQLARQNNIQWSA